MSLPKVRYGDVFQLELTNGYGYIQSVKEAQRAECEIVRVLSGVYCESDVSKLTNIVSSKEAFFAQIPVKYALKQNILKPMGNYPVPSGSEAPRFYRTEHTIGTEFVCWHIVDSVSLQRRSAKELSAEEKKLSEWDIVSIPVLVEKLETGWVPEMWI
ncbi:hypothetical protein acsn021_11590 [Anaerocolumna cellulosilytica]|uniref:Uncharacterized protein n=1 Tax=Anaerocolumna cellulosilytica TaxID=433286 RepID=A0A6S6R2P6_9FIRM|nr:hypothetical protein [Anaerocolumna cellulosilytica]MBB5194645.1 hypothetical protein [Anaerocolumna cellulosilytica]BCJ93590.1 hypothetical protein acsn021_11590 [Anaerocolumna cellulosilytica]